MSHLILTIRKPRRDALYSQEEIAVLSKYKAEYKDQTTKPLRAHVLRNKILVNIFNYWDVQKTLPADEEACVAWVKVNETVKLERLQNLTDGLGTCCLGAKQLAPERECYPVQSEHEGQGNQFGLGDSEGCCQRGTEDTTWSGTVGQQGSTMLSTTQCGSQIGLGEDVG